MNRTEIITEATRYGSSFSVQAPDGWEGAVTSYRGYALLLAQGKELVLQKLVVDPLWAPYFKKDVESVLTYLIKAEAASRRATRVVARADAEVDVSALTAAGFTPLAGCAGHEYTGPFEYSIEHTLHGAEIQMTVNNGTYTASCHPSCVDAPLYGTGDTEAKAYRHLVSMYSATLDCLADTEGV
jgi:hypothetical protein